MRNHRAALELLDRGLAEFGIPPDGEAPEMLRKYLAELSLWSRVLGLSNAREEDLVVRHILDSLSGLRIFESFSPERAADAGSGAGFPGIPLALFSPGCMFDLVERSGRRAGFLRNAVALLGLGDRAAVIERELENVDPMPGYDAVVFRAFRSIGEYYPALAKIAKREGVLLAYKGRKSAADAEAKELARRYRLIREIEIIPLPVPFLQEERHMMVIHPAVSPA